MVPFCDDHSWDADCYHYRHDAVVWRVSSFWTPTDGSHSELSEVIVGIHITVVDKWQLMKGLLQVEATFSVDVILKHWFCSLL